ncbi:hypothetical protein Clacol_010410 [Clathrus columnatus]|uniref:Sugar phosphate transporter domain-containing protein n=1 Tax=Clathrus columnatus TaxID=1419009 RepID=A0AAV5ATR4_9AGAM|nr:hypothetical protein Clacol_010410 [Clathrus columnatus]
MVFANKWVLVTSSAPLFFLFVQLIIAIILFVLSHFAGLFTIPFTLNLHIIRGMAPLVCVNVLGLSFNNYTLKYVDASFYQVARGLVLPFTVLLSYLFLHSRPSLKVLLSCGIVTLGFFIGVFLDNYNTAATAPTTSTLNTLGIFFGLLSSLTTASSAIIIKRSLATSVVEGSTVALAWYSNLLSAIVLLPLVWIVGEFEAVSDLIFGTDEEERGKFLYGAAITGVFGFLICIAGFLSIKVTSPITHMVSSAVRGVASSLLGVWLFNEVITGGRGTSITVILLGSIYYTWVKNAEQNQTDGYQNDREREKVLEQNNIGDLEKGRKTPVREA